MWARVLAAGLIAVSLAPAVFSQSKTKTPAKPAPKTAPKAAPAPAKSTPAVAAKPKATAIPVESGRALPPPKDEAARDPSLVATLTQLKDVLKRKSRVGLESLLAPDVDSGAGIKSSGLFFTAWDLADPNSGVYAVLTQILSLPGVWRDDQYCAPYIPVQFPSDIGRFDHQVALNFDTKLREAPSNSAKVIATLPYSIVQILERAEWTKVRTESGREGYVEVAYLYSPAAYRMCLAKNASGEWKIQSLVPGGR
jgi:hypothetical protein